MKSPPILLEKWVSHSVLDTCAPLSPEQLHWTCLESIPGCEVTTQDLSAEKYTVLGLSLGWGTHSCHLLNS